MARILVSPLSWGLGHATRDIPIIRDLLARGHDVTIASSGRALALLQSEFPQCRFEMLEDYPAPYGASRFFLPKFTANVPKMLAALARERVAVDALLARNRFDLIISDNRFEVSSAEIPTVFISHQLRYVLPGPLRGLESATQMFNASYHRKYARVVVPDNAPGQDSLTGRLSLPMFRATRRKAYYSGIICSVNRETVKDDLEYFISISGPEPQRTVLEKLLLPQLRHLQGRKVVVLGRPESTAAYELNESTVVHQHLDRREMARMMNAARFIITRSGYTTMMELAEMGKKQALLIPTPGQTEQEYLSKYYAERGWFHSVSQYRLDLVNDVLRARPFRGFPAVPGTAANVRRLYDEVLGPLLGARALPPVHATPFTLATMPM